MIRPRYSGGVGLHTSAQVDKYRGLDPLSYNGDSARLFEVHVGVATSCTGRLGVTVMKTTAMRSALFLSVLTLAGAGCRCGTNPGTQQNLGEIGVVWRDVEGNRLINRDATFDFGQAIVGQRVTLTMTVRNMGAGKLTLSKLERTDGDEFAVGSATAGVPFNVEFTEQTMNPSDQVEYSMSFSPTALKGSFETHLLLTAEGTRAEDSTAVITLKGGGEKGACDLPSVIDFGKTPVGDTLKYTLKVENPTSIDANASAGDFTGADATAFGYPAGGVRGSFAVAKMSSTDLIITFSPTEKRAYEAHVKLHGAGECPEQDVTVKGIGSDDVLSWTPSSLEFGSVAPGFEALREVIFKNESNVPITLTTVAASAPADYYQSVPAGTDATKFVVPGGAVPTTMKVACSPAGLGPRPANLTFATGLTRQPNGTITMTCRGGGPKIKVSPRPTLGFGRVGYFPGSTTFNVSRKVTVQNVGTRSNPPQASENLYLGQVVSGMPGQLPLFELVPHAGTDIDEFSVSLASPYDPQSGINAVPGSNFVDLAVLLSPKSAGMKAADLKIYSNDDSEPEVVVALTADAQALPPCNYRVTPSTVNFGLVTPGVSKDLPVTITNLGTTPQDVCYLSGIDLAPGTNPVFTIVGGPIVEKELQPGQSFQVVVRVTPVGTVPTTIQSLTGTLQFNVTSPTTPQATVPLRASIGPSCLIVTPDPLDFATTKIGCNTQERQMQIYNVCSTNVTISSMSLQAAGGQPPGGPDCAGTQPCPEFYLTQLPTIPGNGLTISAGSAPVILKAKYRPIDVGSDQGAIAINALQNGQSVTYLVGLQGNGDTIGQQTDTFKQDLAPKADILLVVDDSCSMSDKQTSLANNFGSFIQYAQAANVDYQIGVTTTTAQAQDCPPFGGGCVPNNSKGPAGKLVRTATVGPILTNASANVAQKFGTLVNVGTDGSGTEQGLETAVMALTPPMITGDNVGFLRMDANLAVVVVSDAGDQSDQPVSYYQNRLINIKGFNRLSMFTFSNIGPYLPNPPSNCSYDGDGDPQRYMALVQATSGVQDEICTTNWATALQGLGRTAFGFRTQFFLNTTPDLTAGHTIDVKINGTSVPTTSWHYDAASNSVQFNPTAVPAPGQNLTIQYAVACF